MEVEKPVLQPAAGLLKCYRDLGFSTKATVMPGLDDMNETKGTVKMGRAGHDNGDVSDIKRVGDNDNDNGFSRRRNVRTSLLVKKDSAEDVKPPSIALKHNLASFDEVQTRKSATVMPGLDCSEFPSFQHRFSPTTHGIQAREYGFIANKLLRNSSDSGFNSISENSTQEETLDTHPGSFQEVEESSGSSFLRCFHQRPPATTSAASVIQNPEASDTTFDSDPESQIDSSHDDIDQDLKNHDFNNYDTVPNEKRPRIERPRARYPNSARRTSAPACLWSATSFLSDRVTSCLYFTQSFFQCIL